MRNTGLGIQDYGPVGKMGDGGMMQKRRVDLNCVTETKVGWWNGRFGIWSYETGINILIYVLGMTM